MKRLTILFFALAIFIGNYSSSIACTNFLVTRGASADGSTFITYAADSHTLYGELYFWRAQDWPAGSLLKVNEWDTGKFLGNIEQVAHTYQVVGNMNEYQLAIGETTYGGREELGSQKGAIIDYGSLIYITLSRAKNAREAIKIMGELVAKYGYYSSGESFSIQDPNEVWILEMIGKADYDKGAVWVARRIPDGYISGHANHARIETFPLSDGKTSISSKEFDKINLPTISTVYAYDVVSFARDRKWYEGADKDFNFSEVYAPVDFGGARFSEARVWAGFRKFNSQMDQYLDYAMGKITRDPKTGFATNRMPLWVKPDHKLTVKEMMDVMRDHYEGTPLDMTTDVGAGAFGLPYRWRPLTWKSDDVEYLNERAIATQQTGFIFVAQSRAWLPEWVGGIIWWGVDDAATNVFMPLYCGLDEVPEAIKAGNGDMLTYSPTSMFWIFNRVTNFAYMRYNMVSKDIIETQTILENKFIENTAAIDAAAMSLYKTNPAKARQFVSEYSNAQVQFVFNTWQKLDQFLLVKYLDGNVKKEENRVFLRNGNEIALPASPNFPGYSDKWKKDVIKETGDKLKMQGASH